MKTQNRIKAFTLIELLVALAVSALVISMAYGAYALNQKIFEKQKKAADNVSRLLTLQDMLRFDLTLGKEARRLSGSVILIEGNDFKISYEFIASGVIRKTGNVSDTIDVTIRQLNTALLSRETQKGLFDELSFLVQEGDKSYPMSFYKPYGAAVKMNQSNHEH